jgi:type II secretory pathway pseudopilin PulG
MPSNPKRAQGVVMLTVLVFILVTTLAASSLVVLCSTQTQREKEEELLFVGDQFRRAIASYYSTIPRGGARALPPSLEALIDDQRFPQSMHHLRRIYSDPMTGKANWQLVRQNGGIVGVRSQSERQTIKKTGFDRMYQNLENAELYSDWVFSIQP